MDKYQFLARWLSGSTCHNKKKSIFWQSHCGRYVILKHHGHSSYCDRSVGTLWCGTFYALYDIQSGKIPDYFGYPAMHRWEGRWKLENWVLATITIHDYDPGYQVQDNPLPIG